MFKKIVLVLVIFFLVLPPFVQVTQAGPLDSTVGFSSCAAAGFISGLISDGLNDLQNWAKDKLKGWLGIGGVISSITKVPVDDSGTHNKIDDFKGAYAGKENAQDIIARCGAREILTAMGRNITNVARTGGRDGGAAWVRNWRNFLLDSQYRGEGIFRGVLASTKLCKYFDADLKGTFKANQNINLTKIRTRSNDFDSFQVKAGCTLPSNFDFNAYKQDFSGNGGWEAWSRLLEPQNNFYGSLFMSLDEADRQRAIEEAADLNEAGPTGFTATRGRSAADSCAIRSPAEGRCLVYKDILTPGNILSGAVTSGIESELQWIASTDELNELIATGIQVLVNRLWDLSNSNEGDYIVPGKVDASVPPFPPPTTEFCGNNICESGEDSNTCPEDCSTTPNVFGNITVNFQIINDSGGAATVSNFGLFINGDPAVIGLPLLLPVGSYTISTVGPSGYTMTGISGDCTGSGGFTLTEGQNLACTVTYDDD